MWMSICRCRQTSIWTCHRILDLLYDYYIARKMGKHNTYLQLIYSSYHDYTWAVTATFLQYYISLLPLVKVAWAYRVCVYVWLHNNCWSVINHLWRGGGNKRNGAPAKLVTKIISEIGEQDQVYLNTVFHNSQRIAESSVCGTVLLLRMFHLIYMTYSVSQSGGQGCWTSGGVIWHTLRNLFDKKNYIY
jgi:hypothetical protein